MESSPERLDGVGTEAREARAIQPLPARPGDWRIFHDRWRSHAAAWNSVRHYARFGHRAPAFVRARHGRSDGAPTQSSGVRLGAGTRRARLWDHAAAGWDHAH